MANDSKKKLRPRFGRFVGAGIFAICRFNCIVKNQFLFLQRPYLGKVNSEIVQCDPGTSFGP